MTWNKKDRKKFIEKNPQYQEIYYLKHRDKKMKYQREYEKDNKERLKIFYKEKWRRHRETYGKVLKELKLNGCAICGYDKCDEALDFHHSNPIEKKFKIDKRTISYGDERITNELNKCILLCSNCHREIHKLGREKENMERDKK